MEPMGSHYDPQVVDFSEACLGRVSLESPGSGLKGCCLQSSCLVAVVACTNAPCAHIVYCEP